MILSDNSFGIIPVVRGSEYRFLLIKQSVGHWSFPKGHKEENETSKQTALRELSEETGILKVQDSNLPVIIENYSFTQDNQDYYKTIEYYIYFIDEQELKLQTKEVIDYKLVTYQETLEMDLFDALRNTISKAKKYLDQSS